MKQQPELLLDNLSLETAIDRAINFLWSSQLPDGEFATYLTEKRDTSVEGCTRTTCYFDSCNYSTALIIYCLSFRETPKVKEMISQGLNFLLSNMVRPGIWHYYPSKNPYLRAFTSLPDISDTSCVSFILTKYGISLNNKKLLLANRNQDGLFSNWLIPSFSMLFTHTGYWFNYRLKYPSALKWWEIFPTITKNVIDLEPNTNLVLYLGEIEETQKAIDYVIDVILKGKEEESDFYFCSLVFGHYYFISRAYFNGINRLGVLKEKIISRLENASYDDPLNAALAACTLLNFSHLTPTLDKAISFLLNTQEDSGNWPNIIFYFGSNQKNSWYGSAELTTSFCIEALVRYQQAKSFLLEVAQ
ncbi:hypothetical protein VB620_06790 [Nodularia harveyana UHCC-0300]|uniref:Prenyltransferase n=1 Tax=Nodularia harveyana UHCC-0300 TaxID=2974287 RepID=A0ABU5UBY6_9CYAN|nr:hypothetical protein [Nodularia harveyana]MEA5581045.1 hypothetical protein [Nodularia harveyana UHCC-0300]